MFRNTYSSSKALVIGINNYIDAPPLLFASNDAAAFADVLVNKLGFKEADVILLLDGDATAVRIRSALAALVESEPDSRIVVFFAGHGHTKSGHRGEVGFLVPVEGDIADISSLIRWHDLVQTADLIPAKHVLFIIDACYGGLALSRRPLPSGQRRFLADMLGRRSRQVLTAGKADESVSDADGTRPAHSIFTSHLLDAIDDTLSRTELVLTATTLMALVQKRVATDARSQQTPHFGHLDGDGDLILDISRLLEVTADDTTSSTAEARIPDFDVKSFSYNSIGTIKRLLGDERDRVALEDSVVKHLRLAIEELTKLSVINQKLDDVVVASRVTGYDEITATMRSIVVLLAKWGRADQIDLLKKVLSRFGETDRGSAGLMIPILLGWYPTVALIYVAGIAALASNRYDSLAAIMHAPLYIDKFGNRGGRAQLLVHAAFSGISDAVDAFKLLPGHERHQVPMSEYLFISLRPTLEEQLFLGAAYETLFDEFEVLVALVFADHQLQQGRNAWGPLGRFSWKQRRDDESAPFTRLVASATADQLAWAPLKAGMFGGSWSRFEETAKQFQQHVLARLNRF